MKRFTTTIIISQSQHSISYSPHLTLCQNNSSQLGKLVLLETSLPNFVLFMLLKHVYVKY